VCCLRTYARRQIDGSPTIRPLGAWRCEVLRAADGTAEADADFVFVSACVHCFVADAVRRKAVGNDSL
jgi:hypothetical protein